MTQKERRQYLIRELLREKPELAGLRIPADETEERKLLRSLFNIRMPKTTAAEFLEVQNAYLQEEIQKKGITDLTDLTPVQKDIYLWKGDITTLRCGAIVNAANRQLLGCFCPCHGCVDNAIHTFSGVQLRAECARLMRVQGHEEEPGGAKITKAYNLPCQYILHTVGPIVRERATERDRALLASCYRSCLELAEENGVQSVAFCCISTGEFHFPNAQAAEVAIQAVKAYRAQTQSQMKVIFNVFQKTDYSIYRELLGADSETEV